VNVKARCVVTACRSAAVEIVFCAHHWRMIDRRSRLVLLRTRSPVEITVARVQVECDEREDLRAERIGL
jgi:hypothetical protein